MSLFPFGHRSGMDGGLDQPAAVKYTDIQPRTADGRFARLDHPNLHPKFVELALYLVVTRRTKYQFDAQQAAGLTSAATLLGRAQQYVSDRASARWLAGKQMTQPRLCTLSVRVAALPPQGWPSGATWSPPPPVAVALRDDERVPGRPGCPCNDSAVALICGCLTPDTPDTDDLRRAA
jgi:hypothetical protein